MAIVFSRSVNDAERINVDFHHKAGDHDGTSLDRDEAVVILEALEKVFELIPDYIVGQQIKRLREVMSERDAYKLAEALKICAWCKGSPVVTNLDGEDLCRPCATKWSVGEGIAALDNPVNE